jgi:hypothetical protein
MSCPLIIKLPLIILLFMSLKRKRDVDSDSDTKVQEHITLKYVRDNSYGNPFLKRAREEEEQEKIHKRLKLDLKRSREEEQGDEEREPKRKHIIDVPTQRFLGGENWLVQEQTIVYTRYSTTNRYLGMVHWENQVHHNLACPSNDALYSMMCV